MNKHLDSLRSSVNKIWVPPNEEIDNVYECPGRPS